MLYIDKEKLKLREFIFSFQNEIPSIMLYASQKSSKLILSFYDDCRQHCEAYLRKQEIKEFEASQLSDTEYYNGYTIGEIQEQYDAYEEFKREMYSPVQKGTWLLLSVKSKDNPHKRIDKIIAQIKKELRIKA